MPKLKKVYWDSCVIIDWLENTHPERIALIEPVVRAARDGHVLIVTSAWSMTEVVRLKGEPLTDIDEQLIVEFFKEPYIELRTVDRTIATIARQICRQKLESGKGLKPPDAVHVATAVHLHIDTFHTFDVDTLQPFSCKYGTPPVEIGPPSYTPSVEPEPSQIPDSGQRALAFLAEESHEAENIQSSDISNTIREDEGPHPQAAVGPKIGDGQNEIEEEEGPAFTPVSIERPLRRLIRPEADDPPKSPAGS
jgi:predicted nucleic acid-binding protein